MRFSSGWLPTAVTILIIVSGHLLQKLMLNQNLGHKVLIRNQHLQKEGGRKQERAEGETERDEGPMKPQPICRGPQREWWPAECPMEHPKGWFSIPLPHSVPGCGLPWGECDLGQLRQTLKQLTAGGPDPSSWTARPPLKGALGSVPMYTTRTHLCSSATHLGSPPT